MSEHEMPEWERWLRDMSAANPADPRTILAIHEAVMAVGALRADLDRLTREARTLYRADGTPHEMESREAVMEYRRQRAALLEQLTSDLAFANEQRDGALEERDEAESKVDRLTRERDALIGTLEIALSTLVDVGCEHTTGYQLASEGLERIVGRTRGEVPRG